MGDLVRAAQARDPVSAGVIGADPVNVRPRIFHRTGCWIPALRTLLLPLRPRLQLQLPGCASLHLLFMNDVPRVPGKQVASSQWVLSLQ